MQPQEAVERIWPGRDAAVEELGGGITNHNFKVSVDGESYVLRIGGKDTELLGIDRDAEHAASRRAAEAGVGPRVEAYLEPEGYLVTRFVVGSPVSPEEMRQPETIARVADALRRFHEGPPIPSAFDSFRVVETYRRTAEEHGVRVPAAYDEAQATAAAIEGRRGRQTPRPCHNDLLNANFIDDGSQLWIVDWEYAGMGDIFFDLANFSVNHEFGPAENEALLAAYFARPDDEQRAALFLMRYMSDFREAMWGVVQQGISELDFDFRAYAGEHFERLRRTAADEEFRAALRGD